MATVPGQRLSQPAIRATGRGSGLGLATVHGIVIRAGGEIEVRREPGVGTKVAAASGSREIATRCRPDELRALSRLGFDELGSAAAGIGGIHRAISDRAFRATGPAGKAAHLTHNAIAGGVYAAVRETTGAVGRMTDAVLERRADRDARAVSKTPGGAALLAVVNGLIGDVLERERSDLQEPMGVRVGGQAVSVTPEGLAGAFPAAKPRVAVFVHGLMENEHAWRRGRKQGQRTYGERLRDELGYTPVYVRFNTGRHISENGRSLADLMAALVACWPVEIELIGLIGHSMGGLVSRSACHLAGEQGDDWVRRVRHVVSLGTPHMGSPVAQGVHYASAGLSVFPETRPFGNFLNRRSAGVRDLRHGSLVDEDWRDRDPDALRAAALREVPLLEGATHSFVTATVTRSARHPLGRLVGDTLVLVPSASGRGRTRRIPFRDEDGHHVGGTTHFALLNHPEVYERLHEWLARPPGERADPPA